MKVDSECLKYNVYEYFNFCKQNGKRRGVGVITDKQSVFYTELINIDLSSHEWIAMDIENSIHEKNPKGRLTLRMENIHYFSLGEELIIDLPNNGDLTMSQFNFLVDIFNQIKKYNEENNTKTNILIGCIDDNHFRIYDPYNIDKIIDELKEMITKDIMIEEEITIGKTLDINKQKENMLFQLNLDNCHNLYDVAKFIKKCYMYYEDSYYGELFDSIFPDFLEVFDIFSNIEDLNQELINKVTYQNILEELNKYKNKNVK